MTPQPGTPQPRTPQPRTPQPVPQSGTPQSGPQSGPPRSLRHLPPRVHQPPARPGDLGDAKAAGATLRAAAHGRFRRRSLGALVLSVAVASIVALVRITVHRDPLPGWAVVALALVAWLLAASMLWGLTRADSADAGDLRAATVLRATSRSVTVRDAAGAVWRWRVRRMRGSRRLGTGERVWITGRGTITQPPHLVAAREVAPDRHVVWGALEHGVRRMPSDAADPAPTAGPVIDPDDPVS